MVKFEMHLHTLGRSPCAKVAAEDIPALYLAKGYSGLVVTDHYMQWLFENYYGGGGWEQKLNRYLDGYRAVKRRGEELGLTVLPGMELNLTRYNRERTHPAHEFLLYGITEEFVLGHPGLYELSQEELFALCEDNGILVVQSHPFRTRTFLADYRYLHGVEAFNGNPRQDSFDGLAAAFAEAHNLLALSGGDFHEPGDEGRGGVVFSQEIADSAALVSALKAGGFRLCRA